MTNSSSKPSNSLYRKTPTTTQMTTITIKWSRKIIIHASSKNHFNIYEYSFIINYIYCVYVFSYFNDYCSNELKMVKLIE